MRPDTFKLGNGKCFVFYGDYLIVNLPENKINDCLDALDERRRYEDTILARDVGAIRTLKLTPQFTMQYRPGPKTFVLKENASDRCPYNGKGAELLDWLVLRLERRGYTPFFDNRAQNTVLASHVISEILCIAVIIWFFYTMYLKDVMAAGISLGEAVKDIDPFGLVLIGIIVVIFLVGNGIMFWLIRAGRLKIVTYRKAGYKI